MKNNEIKKEKERSEENSEERSEDKQGSTKSFESVEEPKLSQENESSLGLTDFEVVIEDEKGDIEDLISITDKIK